MPHPRNNTILQYIRDHPDCGIPEIAGALDLPVTETFDVINELVQDDALIVNHKYQVQQGVHLLSAYYQARKVR